MASPTPSHRFRVPTCSPSLSPNCTIDPSAPYQTEYLDCQVQLKDLKQAFSVALQEKLALKSSINRPVKAWKEKSSGSIAQLAGFDRTEIQGLSSELEELYGLLSSSHATIGRLQGKHHALAASLHQVQRELGIFRYQSELYASTTEVKGSLVPFTQIEEVLSKRTDDLHLNSQVIHSLRQDKVSVESTISSLEIEREALAQKLHDLQRISTPERANLAENYRQLALVAGRYRLNEEKISALEEFIKRNRA